MHKQMRNMVCRLMGGVTSIVFGALSLFLICDCQQEIYEVRNFIYLSSQVKLPLNLVRAGLLPQ